MEAIHHGEGPMLVLAGPGSGKTTVIVERLIHLIHQRIPPEKILVVTFTKDAAQSMQNRFFEANGEVLPICFGTFHSVFYHILLDSNFFRTKASHSYPSIATQTQKRNLLHSIIKDYMRKRKLYLDGDDLPELTNQFLEAISYYKNTRDLQHTTRRIPEQFRECFQTVFEQMRECMKKQSLLDFDDMVYECRELFLARKDILQFWQNRFDYICIDEFQDINPLQYDVIKLLGEKHGNIFAVGDDDQSIYGFRGSDITCLKVFENDFAAKTVCLSANYRSTSDIVRAAELLIRDNEQRFEKKLYAAGALANVENSFRIKCFPEMKNEYDYLCELLKEGQECIREETCAVLFRTNIAMQKLARELKHRNIPFAIAGHAENPYQHFIAKDLFAYWHLAKGDCTRADYLRVCNRPCRYLDREAVAGMEMIDLQHLKGIYARRGRKGDSSAMVALDKLSKAGSMLGKQKPLQGVIYILKAIGYEAFLEEKATNEEQLEDWMDIVDFLKSEAMQFDTFDAWERYSAKYDVQENRQGSAITLMTIHASKGLEFDHVFIPDCNEKMYPHGSITEEESIEEERRIFYVGMTRAKRNLELLCIRGTKIRPRFISRFLNPILKNYPMEII